MKGGEPQNAGNFFKGDVCVTCTVENAGDEWFCFARERWEMEEELSFVAVHPANEYYLIMVGDFKKQKMGSG